MTENTELITTTNNMPKSFNPISNIANGTQDTLGKDCNPTANELIVLPNPGNLTMDNPTAIPIMLETANPTTRRYIVIAMLIINVKFCSKLAKESATIEGDGNDTFGHIPKRKTNCHIPIKADINKAILAKSSRYSFLTLFFETCCWLFRIFNQTK
jgi:hypothetical protein